MINAGSAAGALFKTREGLRRSIDTLQWRIEAYNNELLSILDERDACAKSLKQLEVALKEEPSSDEEVQIFASGKRAESSKGGSSRVGPSEEKEEASDDEEEDEEEEEEDELVGSSEVSAKAKGKGRA